VEGQNVSLIVASIEAGGLIPLVSDDYHQQITLCVSFMKGSSGILAFM
jgi:hypothetical protein